jgi:hypothetical protein
MAEHLRDVAGMGAGIAVAPRIALNGKSEDEHV